jgi:hypothetical protein
MNGPGRRCTHGTEPFGIVGALQDSLNKFPIVFRDKPGNSIYHQLHRPAFRSEHGWHCLCCGFLDNISKSVGAGGKVNKSMLA